MNASVQIHNIFLWASTIAIHNWPVILWLALGAAAAVQAYRCPSQVALSFLYGFAGLAFLFEYGKHLQAYLSEPVDFLLIGGLWPLNSAGHALVEQAVPGVVFIVALAFLLRGGFGWWDGRSRTRAVHPVAATPVPVLTARSESRPIPWQWMVVGLGAASFVLWALRRHQA